jgi:natural product precursor
MKKKKLRRLTLNRETIQRLDEPVLRWLVGGVVIPTTKGCGCASGDESDSCDCTT